MPQLHFTLEMVVKLKFCNLGDNPFTSEAPSLMAPSQDDRNNNMDSQSSEYAIYSSILCHRNKK